MKTPIRLFLFAIAFSLVPTSSALAACGVGTTIWEGRDGIVAKALASTTNFWTMKSISTTFEISGCTEQDNLFKRVSNDEVRYYAGKNLDHLATDMARGSGEYLEAFTKVLALAEEDVAAFCELAQTRFEKMFPSEHTTSDEMLTALSELMREHATLTAYLSS